MHGCWHHLAVMLEVQQDQSSLRAGCWTAGCGIKGTGNVENWSTGRPWASCQLLWLHWCTLDMGIYISSRDMLQATKGMEVLIHIHNVPREKTTGRCYLDYNVHLLLVRLSVICVPHMIYKVITRYYDIWNQFLCTVCFSVVPHLLSQYNPITYSMDTPLLSVGQVWVSPLVVLNQIHCDMLPTADTICKDNFVVPCCSKHAWIYLTFCTVWSRRTIKERPSHSWQHFHNIMCWVSTHFILDRRIIFVHHQLLRSN